MVKSIMKRKGVSQLKLVEEKKNVEEKKEEEKKKEQEKKKGNFRAHRKSITYFLKEILRDYEDFHLRIPIRVRETLYNFVEKHKIPDIFDSVSDFITWLGLALEDPKYEQIIVYVVKSKMREVITNVLDEAILKSMPITEMDKVLTHAIVQYEKEKQQGKPTVDEYLERVKKEWSDVMSTQSL